MSEFICHVFYTHVRFFIVLPIAPFRQCVKNVTLKIFVYLNSKYYNRWLFPVYIPINRKKLIYIVKNYIWKFSFNFAQPLKNWEQNKMNSSCHVFYTLVRFIIVLPIAPFRQCAENVTQVIFLKTWFTKFYTILQNLENLRNKKYYWYS